MDNILKKYAAGSGQIVNRDKSTVMFSKNTKPHQKREVMDVIRLTNEVWNEKYLGMNKRREIKIKGICISKERVWKKVQGWKEKLVCQ